MIWWKEGKSVLMQSRRTTQTWTSFRTYCWMLLLIKKNIKGRLEYANIHLDRPVEFLKNVWVMWWNQNFLNPWISSMSGLKSARIMSRRTLSPWSNIEAEYLLWVYFADARSENPVYETDHGFFEVSGHFGIDCDAFGAETEAWWSLDFPAGQPS